MAQQKLHLYFLWITTSIHMHSCYRNTYFFCALSNADRWNPHKNATKSVQFQGSLKTTAFYKCAERQRAAFETLISLIISSNTVSCNRITEHVFVCVCISVVFCRGLVSWTHFRLQINYLCPAENKRCATDL